MTYTCLLPEQEQTFIHKLSSNCDNLYHLPEIIISDSTLSRRRISSISNNIVSVVNEIEDNQLVFVPIQFSFKKLGDEKHRVALLITTNGIEVFDSNSWEYMLNCQKYKNKQNLVDILNKVKQETDVNIFTYNYSLNCISGSCVSFALLFILYRANGLSIDDVCQIFKFYESRTNVHYEKEMDKLLKKKEFNWNNYHNTITNLINNEQKTIKRRQNKSPVMC